MKQIEKHFDIKEDIPISRIAGFSDGLIAIIITLMVLEIPIPGEIKMTEIIEFANAQIEAGADTIVISDPSGTGEILGPKFFEEFVVKYINMLLDGIKDKSVGTIVHICGQMKNVYNEVAKVKSDALSFDSIVSIKKAKEHLGNRVIMGNVSTYVLEFASESQVEAMAKTCIKSGSDIISPACGLGTKSPIANIQSILKAVKQEIE